MARSTFPSQKVQNTPAPDHFWKLRCRKQCTPLWREAHFEVEVQKNVGCGTLFGRSDVVSRGTRKGLCTLSKVSKTSEGFVAFPKTMAGMGRLKRICKDAFSVAGAVQEPCSSEMLGGPGADVLRGVACWSIRSSVFRR